MYKEQLVSILIPNYNKAAYLRETLDSVLGQTYQNWECIIVDDHSLDNSYDILEEYADKDLRFKIVKRPNHLLKGGNSCRNFAFELSRGEFIQWFDSDDLMVNTMIENRSEFLNKNSQADFGVFSGANFYLYTEDSNQVFSWVFHQNNYIESFLALDPPWLSPSCLFKRSFILDTNLEWNTNVYILQDVVYDLKALNFSSLIAFSRSDIDWYWRFHRDGENVGAKRADPKVFPSYSLVFHEFHNLTKGESKTYKEYISSAAYEISISSGKQYSWIFFYYVILCFYKIGLFNFFTLLKHICYQFFYMLSFAMGKHMSSVIKKRAILSLLSDLNAKRFKEKFKRKNDLNSFHKLLTAQD